MMYFIADLPEDVKSFEKIPLLNMIKNIRNNGLEYKVLLPTLVPFLRYLNSEYKLFDIEQSELIFHHIQNIQLNSGTPLTMNDLDLPNDVEKIYTRNDVLLYKNNEKFGNVKFNRFGFIDQVKYFWKNGSRIDIYSDYGFIISSKLYDESGNLERRIFYDEQENSIFEIKDEQVNIVDTISENFNKRTYSNIEEIINEFLRKALKDFNLKTDYLVIDISNDYLITLSKNFPFPEKIIFVFYGNFTTRILNKIKQISELTQAKALITDSTLLKRTLDQEHINGLNINTHLIPTFSTQLSLGQSNTLRERVIYWQIDNVDKDFKKTFHKMLRYRLKFDDLRLILNVINQNDIEILKKEVVEFVNNELEINTTSDEFKMIETYFAAELEGQMSIDLKEAFETAKKNIYGFENMITAYSFIHHVDYRFKSLTKINQQDLSISRIYVNFRKTNDAFKESIVLSNGIPFISFQSSIYFKDGKNGNIIKSNNELFDVLSTYLDSNEIWNKALVESVEMINKNSTDQIMSDWGDVIDG